MRGNRFDDVSKALATAGARRSFLKLLVAGAAGWMAAFHGQEQTLADPGGNSECSQWCHDVFDGADAGHCTADAARGTGPCYACGPKAGPGHGTICGLGTKTPVCCAPGCKCCNNTTCCCPGSTAPPCCGGTSCCHPGDQCCPNGNICCPPSAQCAPFGTPPGCCIPPGGACTPPPGPGCCNGSVCCNGKCCPPGSICNAAGVCTSCTPSSAPCPPAGAPPCCGGACVPNAAGGLVCP